MIKQEQLIRNFKVMNDGEVDFFLGSGASAQSGIPTGANLVWYFKRELYCSENGISPEKYKDLQLPSTQKLLQHYFDAQGGNPKQYDQQEYSHYFEKCYNSSLARKRFIESIVSNKKPSLGYLCLANLIIASKVKNIWTTNFDSLVETALYTFSPSFTCVTCSSAVKDSLGLLNPDYPAICKLHGDYRYDRLQNTTVELQKVEDQLCGYAHSQLSGKGLMVIGYSGSDESIMSFFESHITESDFLSKGLYWANRKGCAVPTRVEALIEKAVKCGKNAEIVEIDSFDDLMYSIYKNGRCTNQIIDNKWKECTNTAKALDFQGQQVDSFIKINAYSEIERPACQIFETDITSWAELRNCIGEDNIIAALYNGHIYCFASVDHVNRIFGKHVKSQIVSAQIDEYILNKSDSIYIGMLYSLIKEHMQSKGLIKYRKNKFYNPGSKTMKDGMIFYEAVEVSLSYIDKKICLNLLPTVHIAYSDEKSLPREAYQYHLNKAISTIYNRQYNDKLKQWEKFLYKEACLKFENEGFTLKFEMPALSCGGTEREDLWLELPAWLYSEPLMRFSEDDFSKTNINQLKGLVHFGPIDCSYAAGRTARNEVKLAVLATKESMPIILAHLNGLNARAAVTGKDAFLQNYEGFSAIYRRQLIVPLETDKQLCCSYSQNLALNMTAKEFLNFMKRGIDHFSVLTTEFHVLVIYIPKIFHDFREAKSISSDFNLHDAIKLYATDKNVKVQFVEERSIKTYDPCKVKWGLSTSLYAKSSGILWHPQAIHEGTAYVGISYAQSEEKGICIGCSQLFDSTGTGIRMILRKIDNPHFYGKNPYMGRDEARIMMSELREQYYQSDPISKLSRIVVHKTTPFMKDEIIGITQAFEGVPEIELIQIQEYSPWRGIRFGQSPKNGAEPYSVKRGTTIRISDSSFLLWTHGSIIHQDLSGAKNYYKGGRGIPAPLLIKRYGGQSSGEVLAQEILMLTKMNWNSGDSLYKILPVTLDFAKILSRMSKQNEAIYNKSYDFRYFM